MAHRQFRAALVQGVIAHFHQQVLDAALVLATLAGIEQGIEQGALGRRGEAILGGLEGSRAQVVEARTIG
jgi:hypothetical protein